MKKNMDLQPQQENWRDILYQKRKTLDKDNRQIEEAFDDERDKEEKDDGQNVCFYQSQSG